MSIYVPSALLSPGSMHHDVLRRPVPVTIYPAVCPPFIALVHLHHALEKIVHGTIVIL